MELFVCRLLGNLYAAEALILMNKIPEAIEHLNPDLFGNLKLDNDTSNDKISDDEFSINTKPPKCMYF